MRPLTSISSARIAACVCAALTLFSLVLASSAANATQNLFEGAAGASEAAKPAPAGRAASEAAKPATGGKAAAAAPKVKVTPAVKVKTAAAPPAVTPTGTATTATTATTETSSGTTGAEMIALALGILLLGGIAFVIVRDARSVAPVVEGATGGTRNPEGRLRKRRAQAKAARLQRKRHRKR
jgi:hypothetical protein